MIIAVVRGVTCTDADQLTDRPTRAPQSTGLNEAHKGQNASTKNTPVYPVAQAIREGRRGEREREREKERERQQGKEREREKQNKPKSKHIGNQREEGTNREGEREREK